MKFRIKEVKKHLSYSRFYPQRSFLFFFWRNFKSGDKTIESFGKIDHAHTYINHICAGVKNETTIIHAV